MRLAAKNVDPEGQQSMCATVTKVFMTCVMTHELVQD